MQFAKQGIGQGPYSPLRVLCQRTDKTSDHCHDASTSPNRERAKAHPLYSELSVHRADKTGDHRHCHCHDASTSPNRRRAKAHGLYSELSVHGADRTSDHRHCHCHCHDASTSQNRHKYDSPGRFKGHRCWSRKVSLAKKPVYSRHLRPEDPEMGRRYPQGYAHSCRVADSTAMFQGLGVRMPNELTACRQEHKQ